MAEKSLYAGQKPVPPASMRFVYLSNGSTTDGVGNYTTPEEFKITCETGSRKLHIARMIVYIEDAGSFDMEKYGNGLTLVNGIHISVKDSGGTEIVDLDGGVNVFSNGGWGALCHDVTVHTYGTGNNSLTARWTFAKSGTPVSLSSGEEFIVTLHDDFTALVKHTFMIQGFYS